MNTVSQKIRDILSHPLARGSLIVFAGSMLTNVGAYLYHVVVGRILGPEKYGELASLYSLAYILNVPSLVVQTVIAKQVASYSANHQDGKTKELLIRSTKLLAIVTLGVSMVSIPIYGYIATFLHVTNIWSVVFMIGASAVLFLAMIPTSALQGYQKFTEAMVYGNISIFLRLIGGAIAAVFGVAAASGANLITTLVGFLLSLIPFRFLKKIKPTPTGLSVRHITKYAVPSMLCILGITSLYSTDVLLVKHYFSSFDAGMYAALAMMGKVIFFAGSSVGYVLFPAVAKRQEEGGGSSNRLIYASLGIVTLISAGLTGIYFLFPELALGVLFGKSYLAAANYLGLFGIFITFFSLSNMINTALLGLGKTRMWPYLLTAAAIQILGIVVFHQKLNNVIWINIFVCATLTGVLLLYYRHERT